MSNGFHQTVKTHVGADGCGIKGRVCTNGIQVSRGVTKDDNWIESNNAKPKVVRRVQRKCCYEDS